MILCDTNILIDFYKNNTAVTQTLRQIGREELAINVVTKAELYFGALKKRELQKIQRHLSLLQRFPLDLDVSRRFIHLPASFCTRTLR